ncbi:DNA polymerase delta, subunit 4-domain-containing protein [Mrakia frigida]|uniref:DNA polymerase delta, subunit 4-domain-containing protein n=1 Tax=Mrakia frigida TaxID=29902 RepID=UPI003FCC0861
MAPPKRSTSASSSSKKNKKSSSLQQSTLSFSKGKVASSQPSSSSKKSRSKSSSSSSFKAPVVVSSDDDEEEEAKEKEQQPEFEDDLDVILQDEEEEEQIEVKELDPRGKEWSAGYVEAKRMMGKVDPIHAENHTKVDTILRIFDLDFRFGPCTSLSRIDRWNRADRLGLEPPSYVKDILLTRQGKEDTKIKESVFYGAV